MRSNFWAPDAGLYGMFDVWGFDHLDVVLASGLGGGSLIYANVMLRKPERTFVREEPGVDGYEYWPVTREELNPHYDRVEELFEKPERYPYKRGEPYSTTPKTTAMREVGSQLGKTTRPRLAVRFSPDGGPPETGRPIPEGEPNLHRVSRSTCRLCGECDVGCNFGSKSTLDLTCLSYVWREAPAHTIRTCCEAKTITPDADKGGYYVGYEIHVDAQARHPPDLLDTSGNTHAVVHADQVILAAGAIGSPRLLLENRASLPRLSDTLGTRLSANGDYFAFIRDCRKDGKPRYLRPSCGPVITTSIHVTDRKARHGRGYYLQDGGAPALGDWAWQMLELPQDLLGAGKLLKKQLIDRVRRRPDARRSQLLAALLGEAGSSAAMMPVLAMGRDIPNGQMTIGDGGLRLDWSAEPSSDYYEDVRDSLEELADKLGGKLVTTGLDRRRRGITVHPVGGCAMSDDSRRGVVNSYGQVHGHPGLWVADGSVMPGPVGPNPSLTIAALADRFAGEMT
jgi:cholesterol oxidase